MTIPPDGASPAPGTGFERGKENTALQAHVAFFDYDDDGIIWPSDTYKGFRELGFSILLSLLAAFMINVGLSYSTCQSILPDPFFRLNIKNMHKARHGSDTKSYTSVGEFNVTQFNRVFDMYSKAPHTHLDFWEGVRMLYGNRDTFDIFGWMAATLEWLTTYLMLWPPDGRMKKEDVLAIYDGTMFYRIADRRGINRATKLTVTPSKT